MFENGSMNQHWGMRSGSGNATSVTTIMTSIEDHAVSNEQFLFQVQEVSLLIQWIICVHQVHHYSL